MYKKDSSSTVPKACSSRCVKIVDMVMRPHDANITERAYQNEDAELSSMCEMDETGLLDDLEERCDQKECAESSPVREIEDGHLDIIEQWCTEGLEKNAGDNTPISFSSDEFEDNTDEDKTYYPGNSNQVSSSEDEEDCYKKPPKKKHCLNSQVTLTKTVSTTNADVTSSVPASITPLTSGLVSDTLNSTKRKSDKKWSRKVRRERTNFMNSGKAYTNYRGVEVSARKIVPLKRCRNECFKILEDRPQTSNAETFQEAIFREYWSLGTRDRRVAFVTSCVTVHETVTSRKRKVGSSKNRQVTYEYFFDIKGSKKKVCKGCFKSTLCEHEKFLNLALKNKLASVSGVTKPEGRGKFPSGNKIEQEKLNEVVGHINSFPAYESHYSRVRTNKKYLPSHLNISAMFKLYREKYENPVSKGIYERVFNKLNLSFKKPSVDTCHRCDMLQMKIKVTDQTGNIDAKVEAETALQIHQEKADGAYRQKSVDKIEARNDSTKRCLVFDLQQCLATPFLTSSVAFYKRQLWTFNLTVHDTTTGKSIHYMWHEALAGRGANEIASCLYDFLSKLPENVTDVTLYSDTCGGQNRNTHVSAMFLKAMADFPHFENISHKFLVSGHSHMECDVDHALIEKQKKRLPFPIFHPHDWYQLVRSTGKQNQFMVREMSQCDFLDFASLLKNKLVVRKTNTAGEPFKWHEVQWLKYCKVEGQISYRDNLLEGPFKKVSFLRRGKRDLRSTRIDRRYTSIVPISVEKKRDLLQLLDLVPPVFHEFYRNLETTANTKNVDPDLEEIDPDV